MISALRGSGKKTTEVSQMEEINEEINPEYGLPVGLGF